MFHSMGVGRHRCMMYCPILYDIALNTPVFTIWVTQPEATLPIIFPLHQPCLKPNSDGNHIPSPLENWFIRSVGLTSAFTHTGKRNGKKWKKLDWQTGCDDANGESLENDKNENHPTRMDLIAWPLRNSVGVDWSVCLANPCKSLVVTSRKIWTFKSGMSNGRRGIRIEWGDIGDDWPFILMK